MEHKSIIWKVSRDELIKIVNSCTTIVAILRHFGINPSGGTYGTLKTRLKADNIDLSHIPLGKSASRGRSFWNKPPIPANELFIENSKHGRDTIKRYIIKDGLIPYKCAVCGLNPEWNGKPLVLILDHKNGKNRDSRLQNLRFVCPNCDHQSPTFGSRNYAEKRNCGICGIEIGRKSKRCPKCKNIGRGKTQNMAERPSKDELAKMVWEIPTSTIAKQYGVVDRSVAKWCESYGITKPGPGYWTKHNGICPPKPKRIYATPEEANAARYQRMRDDPVRYANKLERKRKPS